MNTLSKNSIRIAARHALSLLTLLTALPLMAADWPGWRGPDRTGISKDTGLLKEWPQDGPKLAWQLKAIGAGYSTPSVVGDRLYVLSNDSLTNEFVQALSTQDGSKIWTTRLGNVGNPKQTPNFPMARSTPTVDGDSLYALGSDGDLACLESATGKVRWRKSLRNDFGGNPGVWAYSESPLIDGDTLVCAPGGSNATVIALNKKTGEINWKCAIEGGEQASYSSATVFETGGTKQYLEFLAKGLVSVDAKTGKLLWRYDRTAQGIPTPIAADGMVYSAANLSGAALLKVKNNNGAWQAEQAYFSTKLPKASGGAVKIGQYLFGSSAQGLQCVEYATGVVKWEDKSIGPGSLCAADGLLYLHGENNQMALVEATPDAYKEKGRFTLPDQPTHANMEKAWPYPIIANGRLYIRDLVCLWCYEIK